MAQPLAIAKSSTGSVFGDVLGGVFGGGSSRRRSAAEAMVRSAARAVDSKVGRQIMRRWWDRSGRWRRYFLAAGSWTIRSPAEHWVKDWLSAGRNQD